MIPLRTSKQCEVYAKSSLITILAEHLKKRMADEVEGGPMHKLRTTAATFAASGLAALAVLVVPGAGANAATNQAITSCGVDSSLITAGVLPTCAASTGTIYNPTQISVTVDPSFFLVLGKLPVVGNLLTTRVSYRLACSVDGRTRFARESFQAKDLRSNTQVVNLQRAVGSPEPNQCQVQRLTASTLVKLTALPQDLKPFTFGVAAYGDNGVPGTIWAQYPKDNNGAGSTVCADDTDNGNAGTVVQSFQCENDLADAWIMLSSGQLVHNGDCMSNTGGTVTLQLCVDRPRPSSGQVWVFHGTPRSAGTVTNSNGNACLTALQSGKIDGAPLTVQRCVPGQVGQIWKVPPPTRV